MTARAARASHTASAPASPLSRIYGLGSVYAKTLRDSRVWVAVMAVVLGLVMVATGADYGKTYTTVASRQGFVDLIEQLPSAMRGIYGSPAPAHLATLGGMISFKVAASVALTLAFWSLLTLSSTLAGEAGRGSLDLVATAPQGRRRIAVEKVAAHVTGLAVALVVIAALAWFTGRAYGTLPGDAISGEAAIGFAAWAGLIGLASGSLAFALAPLLGRAGAASVSGAVTVVGFLLFGYQGTVPALAGWATLTWFGWTGANQPLAGQYDWPSLIPVALVSTLFLAIGLVAFDRRDLGATTSVPGLHLPSGWLGLRGPTSRSLGERVPAALAWGVGLGLFGLAVGASAASFSTALHADPGGAQSTLHQFQQLFPTIDLTAAGGFLQLVFLEFGYIFAGYAAVTLIAGWASDETDGRLDEVLTTPLGRARWALSSGLGVMAALAIMTVVVAAGIGLGAALAGSDAVTPMLGAGALGLYALALAGIGLAIGGLVRPSVAAVTVGALVALTFLIDLFATGLGLPRWVAQLALTSHLGQPMVGQWNGVGIALCLVLAVAGLALGALGLSRRDI
ncbi:MAG TPA: hypothetical protein VFN57_13405, partial [Thermomicrobiaceae bacterium]|nr:hypothetical protein [Thermomicrobiaceae bacterium]